MSEVRFFAKVDDAYKAVELVPEIERRLAELEIVEESAVEVAAEDRSLTAVLAGIAVAVTLMRTGGDAIDAAAAAVAAVRKLIGEVKLLVAEVRGIDDVVIEVDGEEIPLDQIDAAAEEALAATLAYDD